MDLIEKWLKEFHEHWAAHDINSVMELFTEDVEYWETPFKKLKDRAELLGEWQAVHSQEDIELETKVFSSHAGKSSVIWKLSYKRDGETFVKGGTYLIELDDSGLCTFFHYTGEAK